MKLVTRFLSLIVLAGATVFYSSCGGGGEDTKSEEEIQLEGLSKVWTLTSAELDGDERIADFNNMKLTLSGTFVNPGDTYSYSITGTLPTPSPWPRSGSWKFGSNVKSQIIRGPGSENLEMIYTLNGTSLTLEYDCDGCDFPGGSGRVESVDGTWVFEFTGS